MNDKHRVADEPELDMVKRHIREGEGYVERQHEPRSCVIMTQDTSAAEHILTVFEQTLIAHRIHIARLNSSLSHALML